MLKDIYMQLGMFGTMAFMVVLMGTIMTWFVALAGVVARPMRRGPRVAALTLLTVFPPSSVAVLWHFIRRNRREFRNASV